MIKIIKHLRSLNSHGLPKFSNQPDQENGVNANIDKEKITMNVDSIRDKLLKRQTKLPLKNPELFKSGQKQFYDTKRQIRETEYIFDFFEPSLESKNGILQVYGLGNGYFSVSESWYPGSLLIFPNQVFLWDVQSAADIRAHSFDIIDVIKPFPNYLIIGTGRERVNLPDSFFEKFTKNGIKVDICPTFEACSSFNVCCEDNLKVCAFLIPANL